MAMTAKTRGFGFMDPDFFHGPAEKSAPKMVLGIAVAMLYLFLVWLLLNQKLLFGDAWISETYDNDEWRTNEGNLPTYGAWDIETHVWKTQFVIDNFPNHQWNPYWYLGMPLLEFYQPTFYFLHWAFILVTGISAAKSAVLLVILGHLLATYLTFFLCYLVSRRIIVSALCATFLLANTFLTLRSYGWEPITVVFLFLYPLGLYFFLKEPLRPFRFSVIATLAVSYLSHPLIFFSLSMFMGLYLFAIAIRKAENGGNSRYLWVYFAAVITSLLLGGIQFFTQMSYNQATSGAHMGVTYLPYYHVPFNIITLRDFLFDAGNLKGPGPIIMIAALLLIIFAAIDFAGRKKRPSILLGNHLIIGLSLALFMMVFFYYIELYDMFPMNLLRSIQYHRIIPEFIITAAVLLAALSNIAYTFKVRAVYYSLLVAFVMASGIIIYNVQDYWQTTSSLDDKPEFIRDAVPGRISFPYTDQSLSVRNSYTYTPQAYGYYEQGITNPYVDELFSVSSGFHNPVLAVLYLKAANVGRLYVNTQEGFRDMIIMARMNQTLELVKANDRYSYYNIPIEDPSFAEAVDNDVALEVQKTEVGCRVIFKEEYCGSFREEFVSIDDTEIKYLMAYIGMLEQPYAPKAIIRMDNPSHYTINMQDAAEDTAVVVKMTYDRNFKASVGGREVGIEPIGPYFMLIHPGKEGSYQIELSYHTSPARFAGTIVSIATLALLITFFVFRPFSGWNPKFPKGDMR